MLPNNVFSFYDRLFYSTYDSEIGRVINWLIGRICYMQTVIMGETTVAQKAHTAHESLRTTIPISIVRQLKMKEGDTLDWELAFENNEMYVKLKKVKLSKK